MTDHYLELEQEVLQLRAALTALAGEKEQLQQEKERYVVLWQEQRSVKEGWRESCLAAHRAMNSIEERAAQKLSAVSTRLAQALSEIDTLKAKIAENASK